LLLPKASSTLVGSMKCSKSLAGFKLPLWGRPCCPTARSESSNCLHDGSLSQIGSAGTLKPRVDRFIIVLILCHEVLRTASCSSLRKFAFEISIRMYGKSFDGWRVCRVLSSLECLLSQLRPILPHFAHLEKASCAAYLITFQINFRVVS